MAQSLDQSVASTTASSVYVIGKQSQDLPIEFLYAARDPEFETRYDNTTNYFVSPDNNASPQSIQWTLQANNSFVRGRSICMGSCFNVAVPVAAAAGFQGATSITPLPGHPITAFDQIEMKLGYNACNVYTLSTQQHIPFMMRMKSLFNYNEANRTALALTGLFYTSNYDYISGIAGGAGGTYQTNNANITAGSYNYGSCIQANTPTSQLLCVTPANAYTTANPMLSNATILSQRQATIGFWQDEGMQQMRAIFMGNALNTRRIFYLTPMNVISEVFKTPCCMPPIPLSFKFNYPYANASRPRYLNTPQITATGGAYVATVDLQNQATYAGITPFVSNFYMLYQIVQLRADMNAAIILAWRENYGINDVFTTYDWYEQSQITSTPLQINLIQANNFVSYMSCMGFRMQYPWQNIASAGAGAVACPPQNTLSPYVWGDCQVKEIDALYTDPKNLKQQRIFWQNGATEPTNTSYPLTLNNTNTGVLDFQNYWNTTFLDQQWFTTPVFNDRRFQDKLRETYIPSFQPACGFEPNANGTTKYGAHAFYTVGNATAWQQAPHNQFTKIMYNGLGFEDENQDYGTQMGSLRMFVQFYQNPGSPVIFDHLMPFLVNINYQGSLNVTTSLSIN